MSRNKGIVELGYDETKPCPWCGSNLVGYRFENTFSDARTYGIQMMCCMCRSTGPIRTTKYKARKAWNKRIKWYDKKVPSITTTENEGAQDEVQ